MARKIFTGKLLVDGTGRAPTKDPYIVVEEGVISEVGAGRPPEPLVDGAELIPVPEATIIPGLVDGHIHLALFMENWSLKEREPERILLTAANNARIALAAGVTTVADCGAVKSLTVPLRDAIAKGQVPGTRIWASGTFLTVTNGHGYFWTKWGLDSAEELRKGVRQMVWEGADFIKIMASGGSTMGGLTNRRRAQYSLEELRAGVEDAHRLNRRVHCHANATEAIKNCIYGGVDVIEHCNWLGVEEGIIEYDEEAAKEGGRRGMFAGINCDAAFAPLVKRDGEAQDWGKQTRWDLMRRMQEAGIKIFFDTDAIGQDCGKLSYFMQRMVEEGKITNTEAIEMATLIPAQAMGLGAKIGSVEKGKLADMVFLAKNPLVDISTVMAPLMVVKDGKVAVKDGKVLS